MRALDICDFTVLKTVNIYPSYLLHANHWASQVVLVVENLPANAGDIRDMGSIMGWEDPLEKGMATHPSILA